MILKKKLRIQYKFEISKNGVIKMKNSKIDDIGKKLDVNSSEIQPKISKNWLKKYSFWMINATNFVLSSLMGLIFGLTLLNNPEAHLGHYPYINDNKFKTYLGVISINLVNGIITIPQKKYSNLNRMIRIGIVILNFIVSLTISQVIYTSLISLLPPNPQGLEIMYNVYKPPTRRNIQNKEISIKN